MKYTRQADVICVGQALVDCIVRGREDAPAKPGVYRAEKISLNTGGDAVNESFNFAQMGYHVRLVCGLGTDLAGRLLLGEMERRGVDTSGVSIRDDMATPVANLVVSEDGSRYSVNAPAIMLPGYIPDKEAVTGARIVSFASLFRAPLDQETHVRELITAAHESGAIIACDTKLPAFRELKLEQLKDVLPYIDYIFPNEREAAYYTGEDTYPAMARKLRSYGIKNVIIKTGPSGCYASLQEGDYTLAAIPVKVVDTTGAGDSFVAGFLSGVLENKNGYACLQEGLQRAALCVQHMGGCI